ncbi:MAG: hypothetical protein ABH833_01470 [Parcubacteria group bacterium]
MIRKTICQNCKKDFVIEAEDFDFYKNFKVPIPTFCWRCRLQRRMASRSGSRTMYMIKCGLCDKRTTSNSPPDSLFPMYCSHCWHGDGWDAMEYGREYDFNKTFFEQFRDLIHSVPRQATKMRNSSGSRYCDSVIDCKDCFMVMGGLKSQDCMYGEPYLSRNTVDSDIVLNADHSYENLSCNGVFNTRFVYFSDECLDSSFLFDCKGCTSCFGCVNLRNQQYRIFNKKYTKEEYKKEMEKWDLGSYIKLQEAKKRFYEFYLSIPRRFSIITNGINVVGDDLQNTKNCQVCFMTKSGVENCKYIYYGGLLLKDSMDVTTGGEKSQLMYESVGNAASERALFSNGLNTTHDIEYSEQVFGSSDIFGCVGIKHRKYCILNKQYSKEEYKVLRQKITKHMNERPFVDKNGREYKYGEYFPIEHNVYAYNESWAFQNFRMTKGEALDAGYGWRDREQKNYDIDIRNSSLLDHVKDADNSIANKAIECLHKGECNELCTKAFRIIPDELKFYRQMNIALPRLCPNCRYFQRLSMRNSLKLWHRACQCVGDGSDNGVYNNTDKHFHGNNHCPNEFETAISPERKEIVYCQQCYNDEFV